MLSGLSAMTGMSGEFGLGVIGSTPDFVLMEDGTKVLMEDGTTKVLMEDSP